MKRLTTILLAGLVLISLGCGNNPEIRLLSSSSVVLAFGDSLTVGTGAKQNESYPSVLAELLQCEVINEGIPGEVTKDGLLRLPDVLEMHRPNLVILCHGGNDMLNKEKKEVTISNLSSMISVIRASGADVILLGVPKLSLRIKMSPIYKEISTKYNIPLESDVISNVLSEHALKSDRVHPNAKGYRKIAESVAKLIRKSTKL